MILVVGAGVLGLGLVATGEGMGWPILAWLGWLVPGAVALLRPPPSQPRLMEVLRGLGAWGAALLVITSGVALACALGDGVFDPGGEGLRQSWMASHSGSVALSVSALHTIALGQLGLVVGAPLYALPQGVGLSLWASALDRRHGPPAVGVWVGLAALLQGDEILAGFVFGAFLVLAAGPSIAGRGVALAGLVGLPSLGPLLAAGPAARIGWASVEALVLAVSVAIGIGVWTLWRARHRPTPPRGGGVGDERGAPKRIEP